MEPVTYETNSMRKNATSFRPKKHQDENASEASNFLCTHFQMSTKHMEPVRPSETNIRSKKRTPTAPLASKKKMHA